MFNKYSSIENSYREKAYEAAFNHPESGNVLWNVTEKLDGTNFSIVVTKDTISPAKRSGFIAEGEKFFGYQDIYETLKDKARDVYICLSRNLGYQPEVVQIYGEYVGKGILNRVDYGEKGFYVFDISVDGRLLDSDKVTSLCSDTGLKEVPVFFLGNSSEVKEFHEYWKKKDFAFNSSIKSHKYGKLIEECVLDNVAEGFVIKPEKALYENSGSRIILKCKSSKFKEKEKSGGKNKEKQYMTDSDKNALESISEYITESRVYSVISKMGEVQWNDFGKVLKAYVEDLVEDFKKEKNEVLTKMVMKEVNKLSAGEIRKNWVNILDMF